MIRDYKQQLEYLTDQLQVLNNITSSISDEEKYAKNADIQWGASLFMAHLLAESKLTLPFLDHKTVQQLLEQYNEEHQGVVDFEYLTESYLFRFVLNQVEIPSSIINQIHNKNQEEKTELSFLRLLYNKKHGREEKIELGLYISKERVKQLRKTHVKVYPNTPSINEMKGSEIIAEFDKENFKLKRGYDKSFWRFLEDKAAALYWEEILAGSQKSDTVSLQQWLKKVRLFFSWSDAPRHMSPENRNKFLTAAVELILNEDDLLGWEQELLRLRLETDFLVENNFVLDVNLPDDKNNILRVFKWWGKPPIKGLVMNLHGGSRQQLNSLIYAVIKNDERDVASEDFNKWTIELLQNSNSRPYLTYIVAYIVRNSCPEAIPGLLLNRETISLGLNLLFELDFSGKFYSLPNSVRSKKIAEIKNNLWREGIELAFSPLLKVEKDDQVFKEKVIAEVLLTLARKIEKDKKTSHDLEIKNNLLQELLNYLADLRLNIKEFASDNLINPGIINTMALKLINNWKKELGKGRKPAFGGLPRAELKLMFWLFDLVRNTTTEEWQTVKAFNNKEKSLVLQTIADTIINIYTCELKREIFTSDDQELVVTWTSRQPDNLKLPWESLFIYLRQDNRLNEILIPINIRKRLKKIYPIPDGATKKSSRVIADSAEGKLKRKQAWVYKIRLHLSILINTQKKVSINEVGKNTIKSDLEKTIVNILANFTIDDLCSGKTDIFDSFYERDLFTENEELFPLLAKMLTGFSKENYDKAVNKILSGTDDPVRFLILYQQVIDEASQQKIREKIFDMNLKEYLEEQYWLPEMEKALINSVNAGYTEIAEEIINYGDKILSQHPKQLEWQKLVYRIKLNLAFQKGDLEGLENISIPTEKGVVAPEEEFKSTKDYYKALVLLKNNPGKAYKIFDQLLYSKYLKSQIAVNRFAATIRMAEQEEELKKQMNLYRQALNEWDIIKKSLNENELHTIAKQVAYNKLLCYDYLKMNKEFDQLWDELPNQIKVEIDFLEVAVNNFLDRGQYDITKKLIEEKEVYYFGIDNKPSNKFQKLKEQLTNYKRKHLSPQVVDEIAFKPDLRQYRTYYQDILGFNPEEIAKVVSAKALNKFLLDKIIWAGRQLLERNGVFADSKEENKYNDIMTSILKAVFSAWNWQVTDQPRGGRSSTHQQRKTSQGGVGSRDIILSNQFSQKMAIVEAFRLKYNYLEKGVIEEHLTKIFKYNSIGLARSYIIVYSEAGKFSGLWDKYINYLSKINFEFAIIQPVDDLTEDYNLSGVKVAKAVHEREGNKEEIYHIFLNFGS